jgi:hypothetical protein
MTNRHQFDEARWGASLTSACRNAAATTLRVNGGAASPDVVETVGEGFAACARGYATRVHSAGLDDSVLVDAVHFVADVLAHGEVGSDVRWFDASLDAVLELAAPTRRRSPEAQRFITVVATQLQI